MTLIFFMPISVFLLIKFQYYKCTTFTTIFVFILKYKY